MKNERQPRRLNKILVTAAGLALAAAGTGILANANPTRAEGASPSPVTLGEPNSSDRQTEFLPAPTKEGWTQTEFELLDRSVIQIDTTQRSKFDEDITVSAGTIARGDVKVNGQKLFDDVADTGLIVLIEQNNATVSTPFGGALIDNYNPEKRDLLLQTIKVDEERVGCGLEDGCEESIIKVVGADGSVRAYKPEENSATQTAKETPEATAEPTATPDSSNNNAEFVPAPTKEGWERVDFELLDRSVIQIDTTQRSKFDPDFKIDANTIARGDVKINGIKLFDDDSVTGLIALNEMDGATASTPYGATFISNYNPEKRDLLLQTIKADEERVGCGLEDGCEESIIKVVGADGKVRKYEPNSEPVIEPTETPEITDPGQVKEYVDANPDMDPAVAQKLLDTLIANGFDVNAPENQATLQALIACICKADGSCPPDAKPTPRPTATPKPEEECPDFRDIEKAYKGWEPENAPVVTKKVANAIFQADGLVDGVRRYDNDSSTALITVINTNRQKNHSFRYDYGGDLQPFCPTSEGDKQLNEVLRKDIAQTLARPDITSVKVVTITDNGVKTRVVNER